MAILNVQEFQTVGINPTFGAAAAGGDSYLNNGTTYLFVKNQSASSINVTADAVRQCDFGFDHDLVTAVPAGQTVKIGPLAYNRFNDNNNRVSISYSAVASITVAVVRV